MRIVHNPNRQLKKRGRKRRAPGADADPEVGLPVAPPTHADADDDDDDDDDFHRVAAGTAPIEGFWWDDAIEATHGLGAAQAPMDEFDAVAARTAPISGFSWDTGLEAEHGLSAVQGGSRGPRGKARRGPSRRRTRY
jgi:hypothetical protein